MSPEYVPYYRTALPHYQPNDAPYFVTSRLHGSIPATQLRLLHTLAKKDGISSKQFFQHYDSVLDEASNGPYHLSEPAVRGIVMQSIERVEEEGLIFVWAYCIMPNHMHLAFKMQDIEMPLHHVMRRIKGQTARQANTLLGLTGSPFWKKENYDRVIRDGRLGQTIHYILNNPVKAKLARHWRDWPGTYLAPNCHGFE